MQEISPDIAAWAAYLLVVASGGWVAVRQVRRRLQGLPEIWTVRRTYVLFLIYFLVPIGLFWVLDRTGAIFDTSMFSALLVGFGYERIMAGSNAEEGANPTLTAPGPVRSMWAPLLAFADSISSNIRDTIRKRADRTLNNVIGSVANEPPRLAKLGVLARARAADLALFDQQVQAVADRYGVLPPERIELLRTQALLDVLFDRAGGSEWIARPELETLARHIAGNTGGPDRLESWVRRYVPDRAAIDSRIAALPTAQAPPSPEHALAAATLELTALLDDGTAPALAPAAHVERLARYVAAAGDRVGRLAAQARQGIPDLKRLDDALQAIAARAAFNAPGEMATAQARIYMTQILGDEDAIDVLHQGQLVDRDVWNMGGRTMRWLKLKFLPLVPALIFVGFMGYIVVKNVSDDKTPRPTGESTTAAARSEPVMSEWIAIEYLMWRVSKTNVTETDLVRTRHHLTRYLKDRALRDRIVARLTGLLEAPDLSAQRADRIVGVLVANRDLFGEAFKPLVEPMIEALHAGNPDVRTRINNALAFLADRATVTPPAGIELKELRIWSSPSEDTPLELERHVDNWRRYWGLSRPSVSVPPGSG